MIEVKNTGERILLDKESPLMIARHFCAYIFAKDFISGKSVLDIGCGEGYGSYYLAEFANEAIGIDYDKVIIDYAKDKYRRDNLKFSSMDAADLSLLKDKFDVVCSFQFIEHVKDAEKLLADIRGIIKDNGIFICSTPNIKDASPGSDRPFNRFHVREYRAGEFAKILEESFKRVEMFGVKRSPRLNFYRRLKKIGLFNFLPKNLNPVERYYKRISREDFIIAKDEIDDSLDFMAVCKK